MIARRGNDVKELQKDTFSELYLQTNEFDRVNSRLFLRLSIKSTKTKKIK